MSEIENKQHRSILRNIAHRVMIERGLLPDFMLSELAELDRIHGPATHMEKTSHDLREIIWCSIDNHDSQDLDQLTYAEKLPGGDARILVAIADVDALVNQQSELDKHARHNTTSIYTTAEIFPMLPEKLSNDFTSLGFESDRMAIVVDMIMANDGSVKQADVYSALVRNYAKLSYHSVGQWLEGFEPIPYAVSLVNRLEENLRLQDEIAQKMKALRHEHGALELVSMEATPVFEKDELTDLITDNTNRAKDIIEDFMIAANGVVACYLSAKGMPSLRRVVRIPKRWDRIIELAAEKGFKLPINPDPKALNQFLLSEKQTDPVHFSDLSLSVVKLLGGGEYVVEQPSSNSIGHFGLAVKDYAHSTAPNRRYPDIITQRLLKAAMAGRPTPYQTQELEALAKHCTEAEDAAKKVERQVSKSAAALLLASKIGEQFDGIITGASNKGTYVRLLHPHVEGRLVSGFEGMDVGNKVRVQLISTDIQHGFIDFRKA